MTERSFFGKIKNVRKILEEEGVRKTWEKLSREVAREISFTNLAVVGIRVRGDFLAKRLRDFLSKRAKKEIPLGILDITLYRDDLTQIAEQPIMKSTSIPFDVNGKKIVLVDDVIYTGRTVRAALDELIDFGRPSFIRLAVLIDRGGRELPIQPDFVGKFLDISPDEIVEVKLKEVDGEEGAYIIHRK